MPLYFWGKDAVHRDVVQLVLVVVFQKKVEEVLNSSTLNGGDGKDARCKDGYFHIDHR